MSGMEQFNSPIDQNTIKWLTVNTAILIMYSNPLSENDQLIGLQLSDLNNSIQTDFKFSIDIIDYNWS